MCAKLLQSCLTLCDPMDCSPLGSSVHGILQAKILEWVAISFSRESSQHQGSNQSLLYLLHWQAGSLPLTPPGQKTNMLGSNFYFVLIWVVVYSLPTFSGILLCHNV